MQQNKVNPSLTEPLAIFEGKGYRLTQFKTGDLSIFSYFLESQGLAVVIDPTIDADAYHRKAAESKAVIKYVILTHYHADFVAGHLEFNAPIIMGEKAKRAVNGFKVEELKCGATLSLGQVRLKAIHTPGHTMESTVFQLLDRDGKEQSLFTGDTLFLGQVGRPDLAVSSDVSKQDLAGMLYESLQKLKTLKPTNKIFPGHGSGSSCGKKIGDGNVCTLDRQMLNNYAMRIESKQAFIKEILEGMPSAPPYYFYDAKMNQKGPSKYEDLYKTAYKPLSVSEFKNLANNSVVIDTRGDRAALENGFIKGAFLMNEAAGMTNWIGAMFNPECRFLIFCDKAKASEIIQKICRIGYRVEGFNDFSIDQWKQAGGEVDHASFKTISDMLHTPNYQVLDVRKPSEWKESGVAQGAVCIPFEELQSKIGQIPRGKPLFVHCKSGMRARLAHSILRRNGVDSSVLPVKFEELGAGGVKMVNYSAN